MWFVDDGWCARGAVAVLVTMAMLVGSLTTTFTTSASAAVLDWQQVGADIDGARQPPSATPTGFAGEAVAMSADGRTVIIGAPTHDGDGRDVGQARVFRFEGGAWTQVGSDIDGEATIDGFGGSVGMSADGNTVIIGAGGNDGNGRSAGHARVFRFEGSAWTQLGADLDGEAAGDGFGGSVGMSADGNTVVIGAVGNDGNRPGAGHARVHRFEGGSWLQVGADVDGASRGERAGGAVAMSADGNTIIVGARFNDGNGQDSGRARVYRFQGGSWDQIGDKINGAAENELAGSAVAMSADGDTVIIGAPTTVEQANPQTGNARVYRFESGAWIQVGAAIEGEAVRDQFGFSVAMSADGTVVVIGAPINGESGNRAGHARVYRFEGGAWIQVGADIDGESFNNLSGKAVAINADGDTVIIGAPRNSGNGEFAGHARVYTSVESQQPPNPVLDGEVVLISNVETGRFLDGDGTRRDWNVDTSPDARIDARWILTDNGDGTWLLRNRDRARFLDADGIGQDWNVTQSVTIKDDDRWVITQASDGTFTLRSQGYDRYLHQDAPKNVNTVGEVTSDNTRWHITSYEG